MEQELTVEELIALVNSQKGDFIIRIEFGEEGKVKQKGHTKKGLTEKPIP